MKITIADFRALGICPGARKIFFEPNGLDWRDFAKNGIDADELRKPGLWLNLIDRLEAHAKARNG